jgi:hypothetical protein
VRILVSALIVGAAVALAGCGGSTKTVTVAAKPTTTRVTGTTASGATTTAAVVSPPVATRDASVDQEPVTLSIVSLKRSGATVELTFELSLDKTASGHAQIASAFDDGEFEKVTSPGATDISGGDTLDGIYLVDTADAKKYPVARDSYNQCVCDINLSGTFVDAGAPVFLSATFGAPSADSVNVSIPGYGTFVNVPIS